MHPPSGATTAHPNTSTGSFAYLASNYPAIYDSFLIRLRSVIARIGM
jgi:hypothetical protein